MIIGITGKSGDGKTTAADELCKNIPKSIVLHMDDYHMDMLAQTPEIIELYGPNAVTNGYLNMPYLLKNKKKWAKIHKLTDHKTIDYIFSKIEEYKKKNYETIVVEWIRLPSLKKVWDSCDYRIRIKSTDRVKRYKNMNNRQIENRYFIGNMEKDLNTRDNCNLDYDSYNYDYDLINEYDDSFYDSIKKIANEMKKGEHNEY